MNGNISVQKINGEQSLSGIFHFVSEWTVTSSLSALFLTEETCFHFISPLIIDLNNLTFYYSLLAIELLLQLLLLLLLLVC
jgi:hypothetical protein